MAAQEKIVHLCKLKMCFGKQPVVAINVRDQSVNENIMISNSFDPASPAPNQKCERGRMACTNANANASDDELTVYQLLGQVTQVERDEHLMAVYDQGSDITVSRTLSKGRQRNEKDKQSKSSKATTSTEPPIQRHKSQDLTKQTRVTQLSTQKEVEEENVTEEEDDQMP